MPAAGLHLIHTDRLLFARDGRWYADGEPILHPRLASLFCRYLRRKPGGGFEIWIEERYHADVEVEDTLFVVTNVDAAADGALEIVLSDESREAMSRDGLTVGGDDAWYCLVKGGSEKARFLRAPQSQLTAGVQESDDGDFVLRSGHYLYPITRA